MKQSDDHMDELFRKAGENYPLKTDGADWDKVMARLQNGPEDLPVSASQGAGGKRSSRKLWWLTLLLLPLGWLCAHYKGTPFTDTKRAGMAQHAGTDQAHGTSSPQAQGSSQAMPPSAANVPRATVPSSAPFTVGQDAIASQHANARGARSFNVAAAASGSTPENASGETSAGASAVIGNRQENAPVITPPPGDSSAAAKATNQPKTIPATDTPATAAQATPAPAKPSKGKQTAAAKRQHGLYGGIVAGPDVSTVKWQEIQNPGYSVGVTLGYRFSRRLAVEAQALWDHKVYYTDGQYFNKAKTDIPQNVTLTKMNGNCSMIELPIDLRWDFLQFHHGNGLFATAGLSSYLMKKEAYSYGWTRGSTYTGDGDKSYLNSGNAFFSMLQVSAGYTFKWGHIGDVRIEPYYKIPLRGVGIGSLPMTSTGLYIGITHPFR
jgi:hypothetical protein